MKLKFDAISKIETRSDAISYFCERGYSVHFDKEDILQFRNNKVVINFLFNENIIEVRELIMHNINRDPCNTLTFRQQCEFDDITLAAHLLLLLSRNNDN